MQTQKAGSVREGPCQVETQEVCGEGAGAGSRGHRLPKAQETKEL